MGVPVVERRPLGIGEPDADVRLAIAQACRDAGQRAARADRADEAVDAPAGLLPDLGRGGLDMGLPVRDIVELVGPDRARGFRLGQRRREPGGILHVIVRIAVGHRGHLDKLGAEQPQRVLLLPALGLGDDDDAAKAHRRADERKPDPGVARRALDDRAAGAQGTARHRVADDVECGAILDRLAGVHELGLAVDLAARRLGGAPQADQRRPADRPRQVVGDDHRNSPAGAIGLRGLPGPSCPIKARSIACSAARPRSRASRARRAAGR
jgi:hypothetical protein